MNFILDIIQYTAYWMLGASMSSILHDNKLSGFDLAMALVVGTIVSAIFNLA
jgi:hypothetical protein